MTSTGTPEVPPSGGWYALEADVALARLRSSRQGLTAAEAQQRLGYDVKKAEA